MSLKHAGKEVNSSRHRCRDSIDITRMMLKEVLNTMLTVGLYYKIPNFNDQRKWALENIVVHEENASTQHF